MTDTQTFLTLINESWVSAATPKKHVSAVRAFANIFDSSNLARFTCTATIDNKVRRNGIDYYDEIVDQIAIMSGSLKNKHLTHLRNIGCDCGTEFAPIAYLLSQYREKLLVIWFDAHADLNTPASPTGGSHSGHFHGMVLRALTGHTSFGLSNHLEYSLQPSQIILAGARELDPDEHEYVETEKIRIIPPHDVGKKPWLDALDVCVVHGVTHAYIHIDFDVLEPTEFPWVGCPTPNGISIDTLRLSLEQIRKRFCVLGISAVEISAEGENAIKAAQIAKDLIDNRTPT